MYRQTNHSFDSDSRRSSNNPFRRPEPTALRNDSTSSLHSNNSAFEEWVEKNRNFIDSSDDESVQPLQRPAFPITGRSGSDTNVNYNRNMTNNPFAAAMTGGYKHHRDPPAPPTVPAKAVGKASPVPPPSYAEVAGPKASAKYPQEKESSSRSSRPHRSQSDSAGRERTHRHKSSKKSSKKKPVPPVQMKNLDTIDKLDVSAFFGGRFHHDGPFDACSPHRNKNVKAAPVEAFPVDGPNSSMKAAPTATDDRINTAFGNYEDQNMIVGRAAREVPQAQAAASDDRNNVPRLNPSVVAFDAYENTTPVHGMSTAGLGSTTFLNGAPAPKADDYLAPSAGAGGLGRKKSLVQRLRKNSDDTYRRASNDTPSSDRNEFEDESNTNSLLRRVKSLKVGKR